MKYRQLGRTGLKVSEIGYGAWGIGKSSWIGASDDESIQALHKSIDLGLNFIDTALGYGKGHSESLVGEVMRERSETIYVASKIPPKNSLWPARPGVPVQETFPAEHVIASTEQSLRNLGLDTIDVQQFHVWDDDWVNQGDWLEAVQKLKEQGKIRYFGVSINDYQPANAIKLIQSGVVDTVQVIHNIFEQTPEDELYPACIEHNIGVIVRVPFDEGGLTGRINESTVFPEGDFRNHYFRGERKREIAERNQQIASGLGLTIDSMAEVALKYILSHPAVSTVIPGMRSIRNVEKNCAVSDAEKLTEEQLRILNKYRWNRNFYQ